MLERGSVNSSVLQNYGGVLFNVEACSAICQRSREEKWKETYIRVQGAVYTGQ